MPGRGAKVLVRRFLAYLPHHGLSGENREAPRDQNPETPREENPEALRVVRWAGGREYAVIRSGYVLAFEGYGGSEPDSSLGSGAEMYLLHLLPGAAASSVAAEVQSVPSSPEALGSWAEERIDLFNLLRVESSGFLLFSDMLGLLPYWVGHLEDGIVVSSSIHDLFSAFPELVRPFDPLGAAQFLTGGKGRRTVHARVRASAAGTTIRWWGGEGLEIRRDRRLEAVPQEPDLRTEDAIDRVLDLLRDRLRTFLEGSEEVVLPLTGGFDSRLMACLVRELGIPCKAVTLGYPHHTEVKVARRIANILGLPHTLLAPRGELLDRVPLWLEVQEGQCGFGTAFITELLDRGYPTGTPLLHGLLGGSLFWGTFYSTPETDNTLESIAGYLVSKALADLRPDYAETLGLPVGPDSYVEELIPDLVHASTPVQTFVLWDFEHRHSRGTGAQLPYLGQEYRVGAPYYDRRQFDAWMAVPRMGLENRELVRKLFRVRFPEVASIPHSEEQPQQLPSNVTSLRHLVGHLTLRARDGVLRRVLPGHDKRIEDRYIWKMWHRRSEREIARQLEALGEKRGIVKQVLGWTPEEAGGKDFWNRVARTPRKAEGVRTSYFLLTEYCHWLKSTIPGI